MSEGDTRERAWNAVHDALPPGWQVGRPSFDPGRGRWEVAARSPTRGRGSRPEYVIGEAVDEIGALVDLALNLEARRYAAKLATIDENGRRAYLEGAADEWRRLAGRPPTEEEFRRTLARFPGDPTNRPRRPFSSPCRPTSGQRPRG